MEETEYSKILSENLTLKRNLRETKEAMTAMQLDLKRLQDSIVELTSQSYVRGVHVPPIIKALQEAALRAESEKAAAKAEVEREKDIRRRVHARFKRIRREVALGAYDLKQERIKVESLEGQLAAKNRQLTRQESEALRFAALAYRILDSEDKENLGKEPSFP